MSRLIFLGLNLVFLVMSYKPSFADFLVLSAGQQIKGLLLEEYVDRVLISTYEGEKVIMKNEISRIVYESEDQKLIQQGNEFRQKGDNTQALSYYKKALEVNTDSKQARQLIFSTQARIDAKFSEKAQKKVDLLNMIITEGHKDLSAKVEVSKGSSFLEELRFQQGLILKEQDGRIKIGINYQAPARNSGLESGDILLAMDAELVSYRSAEEVAQLLVGATGRSVFQLGIERTVAIEEISSIREIGCQFSLEYEGLTIKMVRPESLAEKRGLIAGDRIIQINTNPTKYMPFRQAMTMMEEGLKVGALTLTLERQIWLMRGLKT